MVDLIHSARKSIRFTSEELGDPYIYHALADDAARGVRCEIVMMDDPSWTKAFTAVTASGCQLHVLADTTTGLYMHEKLIVVDAGTKRATMLLGSQNASYSSLAFNRELSLELTEKESPKILGQVTAQFGSDFALAKQWRG
jgi:phosphatidylserine/phosphatidylglycerophosphate/cardiolipin synthase-like enzyme